MSVLIAHASISENNTIKGTKGDQTGKEVCVRTWYNKPWDCLIRFNSAVQAEKVAVCMENACANNNIGYSQYSRNTLLNEARKYNYDVSKVNVPVNTDCSALVSVACMYAGVPESLLTLNGNCATTRTLKNILKSTGLVSIYTSQPYLSATDRLKRGDILLKQGSHVVVVIKTDNVLKSAKEVAMEVIRGKWGDGEERKRRLTEAGYNFEIIRSYVNEYYQSKKPVPRDDVKHIWDYLLSKIGNPYGVAGLMGNIKAESNFNPKNLQNSFEKKLGMNDEEYTLAVDSGAYGRFATDSAGYGICQWSYSTRKSKLLESKGSKSIGDLDVQLQFLYYELATSYKGVLNFLRTATSVREASDCVLTKFERPKDQSDEMKNRRCAFGLEIYNKYK